MSELVVDKRFGDIEIDDALGVRKLIGDERNLHLTDGVDGFDGVSTHYIGYLEHTPIAVARLRLLDAMVGLGRDARVDNVGVLEAYRGQSFGRQIMLHVLAGLEDLPVYSDVDELLVESPEASIGFFEKLGFTAARSTFTQFGGKYRRLYRTIHDEYNHELI
ncbi:MAG TPA: GNAT family N-acetyltransferase [Candidatus Saccharimonadales bacterium]|nr:GNAT family N-acetyltransferase [Candidatus Saccharimonadales bacterium]